jgi:hypothetical protein
MTGNRFQPVTVDAGTLWMTGQPIIPPTGPIQAPEPMYSATDLECCSVSDWGTGWASFAVRNVGTNPAINVSFEGKAVARIHDDAEQAPDLIPLNCQSGMNSNSNPGYFSVSTTWTIGTTSSGGKEGVCSFTAKLNGALAPGETKHLTYVLEPVSYSSSGYQLSWKLEARVDATNDLNKANNYYRGPTPWWDDAPIRTRRANIQPAR